MNIYDTLNHLIDNLSLCVTNFKPSRLYIKRILRENGNYIYYFGKSCRENLKSYTGSGVIWSSFISKYGKENVEHVWESDWYYDPMEIQRVALGFSLENNIVESDTWANSKLENGVDGGLISEESKKSISLKLTGIKRKSNSGTSNTMWINNGIIRTCISKNESVPLGWTKGRGKLNTVPKKKLYNNGTISKYFSPGDEIPYGWVKGKCKF